ncbi:MAG: hypothetical protein FJ026_00440 [Chloroflexi bacterium]|nr:hypothetical protein [Chloroflexota bacterium]
MSWTTPVTWTTSLALSVARLNQQLRDNLQYLYDLWAASGWGYNLSRNGSFRAWQAGASSAPDAWVLSGSGEGVEHTQNRELLGEGDQRRGQCGVPDTDAPG